MQMKRYMCETAPSYRITYRFERRDFVAMTRALTRISLSRTLLLAALSFALLLAFCALLALANPGGLREAFVPVTMAWFPMWCFAALFILLLRHPSGLSAAMVFKNNAQANQKIRMSFRPSGVEGDAIGVHYEFAWSALKKVIETKTHLFLAISKREAMIIPRRAFASDDEYQSFRDFITRQLGPKIPLVRQ